MVAGLGVPIFRVFTVTPIFTLNIEKHYSVIVILIKIEVQQLGNIFQICLMDRLGAERCWHCFVLLSLMKAFLTRYKTTQVRFKLLCE